MIHTLTSISSLLKEGVATTNLMKFTDILRLHNSVAPNSVVVAGGTITKIVSNFKSIDGEVQDIDIYVNVHKASDVLNSIKGMICDYVHVILTPVYDASFLKKNGIIMIVEFMRDDLKVQVMITRYDVLSVVTNFDLTCCQVWCDGDNIYGTHLEQTSKMQCQLRGDYVKSLLQGNEFTSNRVNKYASRGFNVTFEEGFFKTKVSDEKVHDSIKPYIGTDWEEVIVKMLIREENPSFKHLFAMATQGYTVKTFLRVYNIRNDYTHPFANNEDIDKYVKENGYQSILSTHVKGARDDNYDDGVVIPPVMIDFVIENFIRHENRTDITPNVYHVKSTYEPITVPMDFEHETIIS